MSVSIANSYCAGKRKVEACSGPSSSKKQVNVVSCEVGTVDVYTGSA